MAIAVDSKMGAYHLVGRSKLRQRMLLGAAVLPGSMLLSGVAAAQEATPPVTAAEQAEDVIIVSGSRLSADSGFIAPTPVTVQTAADFEAVAANNVADILYDLPQIQREQQGGTRSGNPGGDYVNLRNVGSERTLVLIDGRRVVPTSIQGDVDLNTIPSSLVDRVEIVTGGASAAWGSDAVSGVVNLILRDGYEGVRLGGQYNVTEVGDGEQRKYDLLFGHNFFDDRLNVMFAAEIVRKDEISNTRARDWGRPNYASLTNVAPGATTLNVDTDNATFTTMTSGGVISDLNGTATGGARPGLQFGPGGTLIPFAYGTNVDTLFQIGGGGGWLGDEVNLVNPAEREAYFGRLSFEANEHFTLTVEASQARSHTAYDIITPYDTSLTLRTDNAFLSSAARALLIPQTGDTFTMGRIHYEYGPDITDGTNKTTRYMVGAQGDITDNWSYSAYYQHGVNNYHIDIYSRNVNRFAEQLDAVFDPNTGAVICRSTLTNSTNGCVPANVFGPGSVSQAAVDYANGVGTFMSEYTQDVAAFDIQGTLLELPAGPLAVAVGAEWRKETLIGTSDALSQQFAWRLGNNQPVNGRETVKEAFAEANVPLLSDMPFAQQSDLNVAVRFTEYNLAGSAMTWKVGLSHQFNDAIRIRATRSRDLRAPRVNELFSPATSGSGTFLDPLLNLRYRVPTTATVGNINLRPEVANTLTFGVVFQPDFLPGFQTSIDYYDIKIDDAIDNFGTQEVLDRCYPASGGTGDPLACNMIVRDPTTNRITAIFRRLSNLNTFRSRGIDFEASYRFPLFTGDMSMRLLASKLLEDSTDTGNAFEDEEGELGNTTRGLFTLTYIDGPLTLSSNVRYIGGGVVDNLRAANDGRVNRVGDYAYVGASARYDIIDRGDSTVTAFVRVNNLLDRDPPIIPGTGQQPTRTDADVYDVLGRNYAIGLTVEF